MVSLVSSLHTIQRIIGSFQANENRYVDDQLW